jgi:predicted dehydrogenase
VTSLAFAGAGFIAVVHGLAARHLGVPVTAVASRTASRAAERAKELGAIVVSFEELSTRADVVVVSTPPALHATHALAALDAGRTVLLEKPITTTLDEADRLCAHARADHLVYAENLAFAPIVQRFVREVARLGPLTHLEARTVQSLPTWGGFTTVEWGGGALFDLGVHPLAIVLLAAGDARPVAVSAQLAGSPTGDHESDEHAEVSLRFDTGLTARVVSSWRGGPVPSWDAQASSDTGVVRMELFPNLALELSGEPVHLPGATTNPPQLDAFGYLDQLRAVTSADAPGHVMTAEFGRHVLDIVCGAYQSAGLDGAWVDLPFEGPRDRPPLALWRSASGW